MARRLIERAMGFVHDIEKLPSLSDVANNIRLLSDRSLYILQNLSGEDVTFLSRYGEIEQDGFYLPVQEGSPEAETVYNAVNLIRRDLNDMTVEDTLECICDQLKEIAGAVSAAQGNSCGCEIGTDVETSDGEEGGPLPDPVNGVAYEEQSAITDRKCLAANYIHMSIRDVVDELKLNRADQYAFAGLAFVLSIVATVVGALILGPFGLLLGAVAGSFLSMALLLFKGSFSLTLLLTAITADQDGAVCALFEAGSASDARDAYTTHLLAEGATSVEIEFVEYLLSNNLLNLLFFAWGDSESVIEDVTPVSNCSTCAEYCGFDLVFGTGTIEYDGSEFVLSSVDSGGSERIRIQIPLQPAGEGCNREVTVVSATYEVGGPNWLRELYCMDDVTAYDRIFDGQGAAFPSTPQDIAILDARNGDPFTITLTIDPVAQEPCP